MKTVSAAEMRELDSRTIQSGISGEILMERAGTGAVEHILEFAARLDARHRKRFVLLAGKGNNGGDAYVCARHLAEKHACEVIVYSVCNCEDLRGDALLNARRIPSDIKIIHKEQLEDKDFLSGDIIIDGLLGTGFSGTLRAPYNQWIECVNRSRRPVVALDIPSGLDGTTGLAASLAIKADMTVSIGLPKHGLYMKDGSEYCGLLRLVDIGIPREYINEIPEGIIMPFADDMLEVLDRIPPFSHKNTRGRLAVIGGSNRYTGAPMLAAKAAMRSGAGYVKLVLPRSIAIDQHPLPSLVRVHLPDGDSGSFTQESITALKSIITSNDALVIGPGLGNDRSLVPFMEYICSQSLPMVFDADALNLIAQIPDVYKGNDSNILTPHPGEMKRLLEGFDLDHQLYPSRIDQARALAEASDSTIVLKGHRTVICSPDGRCAVNSTGCAALAIAGTGDCLSGIIGTLAAQGFDAFDAAVAGVYIHGLASELSHCGMRGMIPEDLIELIPMAMRKISPFA
ncbi:MAG: NAD(P)H-hydrate dehydratase [Victivallales bacterium]|nr:NAD(P)H-hydrate dehydratase [Victivallales bacterium]